VRRTRASLTGWLALVGLLALLLPAALNVFFRNPELGAFDMARESLTSLSPSTTDYLESLSSPVKITYYVTEKRRMPTPLRSLERDVRALLRQMGRWAPGGTFSSEVVHPEDRPQEVRGVGRFRISSFQHKTILKDEYRVSTVWSGLLIEYKGISRAIPSLTSDHLPHLENRIVTHLRQIDTRYVPSVAVRSVRDNRLLASTLATVNLGATIPWIQGDAVPPEADAAFLLQPENLSPLEVESVDRFLKDGKDVYLFFSPYRIMENGDQLGVVPVKSGLEDLLAIRGAAVENKMLMGGGSSRPYDLRLPASLANLEGFVLTSQGTLLFPQAAPLSFDPVKGKAAGFFARTLLISDEKCWSRSFVSEGGTMFSKIDLETPSTGHRQSDNLGVLLTSEKPWEGKLFLFSSGYLFDDAVVQLNSANGLYLKNLLMTFAAPELLTSIQASRKIKPTVGPLSGAKRLMWRAVVMGFVPLLGLLGLWLSVRGHRFVSPRVRWWNIPELGFFVAGSLGVALLLTFLNRWTLPSWDATQRDDHTLSPLSLQKIRNLKNDVKITYYRSPADRLPPALKDLARRAQDTLGRLAAANRGRVSVRNVVVPDNPTPALVEELARVWVSAFPARVIEQDRYIEKEIFSALVFETNGRAEIMPQLTLPNLDRLEFVTVSALDRLQGGRRPSVGVLVDLPRLTAAEFWELEQLNIKVMPKSEDVYARLIELLRNEGYAVRLYDTKTEIFGSEDVLIYLQPWVITPALREALSKRLGEGGNVLIAAQHYRMQARKYPGHAYAMVYWPQPQFSRINEFLEPYGVELVKEVFLDQSKAPMAAREQINWGAYRKEQKRAPDAQPFLVRAVPENFAKDSPITARLSDVLLIWPNRWRKVAGGFAPGLEWKPLVSSSKDAWAVDWNGGFLSSDDMREGNYFDAEQPFMVEVSGIFPSTAAARGNETVTAAPHGGPGRLLLLGCSEIFSNENLNNADFDNQKFFLNSVAALAYGTDLAWVQARGGRKGQGFPFVPPGEKLFWRFLVLGFVPSLLAFTGWRRIYSAR
jgi:ABC-type uncharacterized transport system involved in gliding motility auxiliary subunit